MFECGLSSAIGRLGIRSVVWYGWRYSRVRLQKVSISVDSLRFDSRNRLMIFQISRQLWRPVINVKPGRSFPYVSITSGPWKPPTIQLATVIGLEVTCDLVAIGRKLNTNVLFCASRSSSTFFLKCAKNINIPYCCFMYGLCMEWVTLLATARFFNSRGFLPYYTGSNKWLK